MRKAILFLATCLLLNSGSTVMARSPLPNLGSAKILSPVCVVSGLPEAQIQILQQTLCAEMGHLLEGRKAKVEVLALNDLRVTEQDRLLIGLRGHVETLENGDTVLLLNVQLKGDQRLAPTAAHAVSFDAVSLQVTPAVRERLRQCLHEQGLM